MKMPNDVIGFLHKMSYMHHVHTFHFKNGWFYSFLKKLRPIDENSQKEIVYSNPLFFSPSSSFLNIMKDNIYSQTFIQNIPQALRSLKFSYCNCHLINMKVLINQQQQNLYIEVMILISIMMMLKLRTKKNSKKKKGETIIKGQKNGCHFFLRKGRMLS